MLLTSCCILTTFDYNTQSLIGKRGNVVWGAFSVEWERFPSPAAELAGLTHMHTQSFMAQTPEPICLINPEKRAYKAVQATSELKVPEGYDRHQNWFKGGGRTTDFPLGCEEP